jgi:hypothetical protein
MKFDILSWMIVIIVLGWVVIILGLWHTKRKILREPKQFIKFKKQQILNIVLRARDFEGNFTDSLDCPIARATRRLLGNRSIIVNTSRVYITTMCCGIPTENTVTYYIVGGFTSTRYVKYREQIQRDPTITFPITLEKIN